MGVKLTTVRGYNFFEVSSALQKAIRRADLKSAGYWAIELYESGYKDYVWRRLLVISAEDIYGCVTQEVIALKTAWEVLQANNKLKGKIFVSKAVVLLCLAPKSREADHLIYFGYTNNVAVSDEDLAAQVDAVRSEPYLPIPDYAYDVHTPEGKRRGKTKEQFFVDEQKALSPRMAGLFDDIAEGG